MPAKPATSLTPEHQDFFERFRSFWTAPSGGRVAEIIAADAQIYFTGQATMSGADYINYINGMLDAFPGMLSAITSQLNRLACLGETVVAPRWR